MKMLLLSLCASVAFACGGGNCANGKNDPFLEPIAYAVSHLGLEDKGDIGIAIKNYRKTVSQLEYKIPAEAFGGGNFNAGAYAVNSSDAKKLEAQIDLIDTLYMVFNDDQKKMFPVLLGIYQHHSDFNRGKGGCNNAKGACGFNANSCGTKQPLRGCSDGNCEPKLKNSCDGKIGCNTPKKPKK